MLYSVILFYMKVKTAISIDLEFLKGIESQVKNGKFANKSHGFEYCVRYTKNNEPTDRKQL